MIVHLSPFFLITEYDLQPTDHSPGFALPTCFPMLMPMFLMTLAFTSSNLMVMCGLPE